MKTSSLVLSLLLLLSIPASTDQLTSSLDKFNREYPQEKVYLHLDKPYYYSDEDIWFKAYLVAGPDHLPSKFSDNIYAELIDAQGNVLMRNRILLENGMGRGDFELPELMSGNYTIRAYTNWMRNFDPEFFFEKELAIISPIDGNPPEQESKSTLNISFHPEGGDLIENVPTRVAVKLSASDRIGNGQLVSIRDNGEVIQTLRTNDDGIALFDLTPLPGHEYTATYWVKSMPEMLPQARKEGYVLKVDPVTNDHQVLVEVHTYNPDKTSQSLYIIGQTRGSITVAAQLDFKESVAKINLPKANLMDGITHLTLFNESWLPEAERLFFHEGNQYLNIDISSDDSSYVARDSTIVDITVTDESGAPVQGSFSLAALDANQIDAALDKSHIMSELLLSSDLKGYIANPARFFGAKAAANQAELDLIMMTHGWRRFNWKDLLADRYPETEFGVQKGITVQGRLLSKKGGEPVVGGEISHIGQFNDLPSLATTKSLEDGFFALGNLYFYNDEENYLQGKAKRRKKKMKELYVEVDTTAITIAPVQLQSIPIAGLDTTVIEDHIEKSIERQQLATFMEFDDEARDLGEVVVEAVRPEDADKYSTEFHRVDFDKYAEQANNGVTALDLLRGRMPNLVVRGIGSNTQALLTYNTTIRNPITDPIVLLDGQPIGFMQLRALPAYKIKKAEIYKGTNEYLKAGRDPREAARGGVLEFYTRTEEELLEFFRLVGDKNVKSLPGGLYRARTFFAPRYEGEQPENPLPDKRMLIHWEPMIQTDSLGRAQLSFFNADLPTTIIIEVQGLSFKGVPGMGNHSYEVKAPLSASR